MKNLIFRFRKRKKVKPYKVDTSQKGFEYVGIKLSDEQFQDMCNLNLLLANDRKDIPVFNMLVLMKVLGLLPSEMMRDNESDDSGDDIYERKFGKIRRWVNLIPQKGNDMLEETNALLKQILEELKAIREEVAPTRTKKVKWTYIIW